MSDFVPWQQFPDWWKAVSIISTGFFGTIGLLGDFRDKKTNNITKFGWISLTGILISTTLGTLAQVIDTRSNEIKSLENERRSNFIAAQTLDIVKNTKSRIEEIRRSTHLMNENTVFVIRFLDKCGNFKEECKRSDLKTPLYPFDWGQNSPSTVEKLNVRVDSSKLPFGTYFEAYAKIAELSCKQSVYLPPVDAVSTICSYRPYNILSRKINSLDDLKSKDMILSFFPPSNHEVVDAFIRVQTGETLHLGTMHGVVGDMGYASFAGRADDDF